MNGLSAAERFSRLGINAVPSTETVVHPPRSHPHHLSDDTIAEDAQSTYSSEASDLEHCNSAAGEAAGPICHIPEEIMTKLCAQFDDRTVRRLSSSGGVMRNNGVILNRMLHVLLPKIATHEFEFEDDRHELIYSYFARAAKLAPLQRLHALQSFRSIGKCLSRTEFDYIITTLEPKTQTLISPLEHYQILENELERILRLSISDLDRPTKLANTINEIRNGTFPGYIYSRADDGKPLRVERKEYLLGRATDAMRSLAPGTWFEPLKEAIQCYKDSPNFKLAEHFETATQVFIRLSSAQQVALREDLRILWKRALRVPLQDQASISDEFLLSICDLPDPVRLEALHNFIEDMVDLKEEPFCKMVMSAFYCVCEHPESVRPKLGQHLMRAITKRPFEKDYHARYIVGTLVDEFPEDQQLDNALEFAKHIPILHDDFRTKSSGTIFELVEHLPKIEQLGAYRIAMSRLADEISEGDPNGLIHPYPLV